ncbi:tyrosine-type recombinase/integrase [Sulfurimonas sp. NWX367]|uniref:tyrosine-type recombinase/integrase n=1 Tax=Sulfurimonas sp. NWX367 TaxID=2925413 RepID=UPI0032046A67
MQEFHSTKYPALYKSTKEYINKGYKYQARIMIDGKAYKKILGYSKKDKLTDRSANLLLQKFKENIESGYSPTKAIKLDKLFEIYFDTLKETKWKTIKGSIYHRYIGSYEKANRKDIGKLTKEELQQKKSIDKNKIGHKSIDSIKQMHISKIISNMDAIGLSPRTQKSILEVLKPMFKFAVMNKITKEDPTTFITVKIPSQKKIVTNATELFKKVYAGIVAYYHDNPYYKTLFLFGFTGRRKSEILNLKWENIDIDNNYYWIEDTKNDDKQKYQLPPYLKESLLDIKDERNGLVFKSPITGGVIANTDRQMRQLKKFTGIENLSLHYMRNILVSALAEQQVEAITLSGLLGHRDVNTINKYLSTNHYKSSQIGLNKVDDILDVEIVK